MENNNVGKAFGWKLLERFGALGIQFVLQLILARLLAPEHYGSLSIMIIFIGIANVFIQNGFNTALIQKKDVDNRDYSSVFWVTMAVAGALYVLLFFFAPAIARLYDAKEIVAPFRVLGIMLFPGAFNSIQLAKISREMNFKKVFVSNILAVVISGVAGVVVAYLGGGLWALVAQNTINVVVSCITMMFTVKWFPKFILDFKRIGVLIEFGWKLLVSGLLNTIYNDLRSLVIGLKYNNETLGYYNRGKHFPQLIVNAVDTTMQSVMLPALAKEQDEKVKVKKRMRDTVVVSAYIIFPMMMGLAVVASPLISILLTDKWLPAVPYMQIYCFSLAFTPIHSCNLQAINAVGRSDVFLKLEIIKKTIGIVSLVIAVFCFDSPIAIALTGVFTTFTSCFINAYPNKKLINYSYFEQMKDIIPSLLVTALMGACAYAITFISLGSWLTLIIQIVVGMVAYVAFSALFKLEGFRFIVVQVKGILDKKKNKIEK